MFTRSGYLTTARNKEKTSKCDLTSCKAAGHPLAFIERDGLDQL